MINTMKLYNFKCFENTEIRLNTINILTGINGMGKSTVLQAMLLLRQSYKESLLEKGLNLNGSYINLGLGKDVLYEKAENDNFIGIGFTENNESYDFKFQYESDSNILPSLSKKHPSLSMLPLFSNNFIYLSSLRIAPKSFYRLTNADALSNREFFNDGEYAIQYLKIHGTDEVKNSDIILGGKSDANIIQQVQKWLNIISPGANAQVEIHQLLELSELRYEFTEGRERSNSYKSVNVGFGLTYVLPIIITLLTTKANDIILLENPEAHIHPAGQRMLGEMIARAGLSGAQIFIETHSDHILNGLRIAVKNRVISKDKINIQYFYRDDADSYRHKITYPGICEDGSLDSWPDGFFDEWDKALMELI